MRIVHVTVAAYCPPCLGMVAPPSSPIHLSSPALSWQRQPHYQLDVDPLETVEHVINAAARHWAVTLEDDATADLARYVAGVGFEPVDTRGEATSPVRRYWPFLDSKDSELRWDVDILDNSFADLSELSATGLFPFHTQHLVFVPGMPQGGGPSDLNDWATAAQEVYRVISVVANVGGAYYAVSAVARRLSAILQKHARRLESRGAHTSDLVELAAYRGRHATSEFEKHTGLTSADFTLLTRLIGLASPEHRLAAIEPATSAEVQLARLLHHLVVTGAVHGDREDLDREIETFLTSLSDDRGSV